MTMRTAGSRHLTVTEEPEQALAGAALAAASGSFTERGRTEHFVVSYDDALGESGQTLADSVLGVCEDDYGWCQAQFGGGTVAHLPMHIKIAPGGGGASHPGCSSTSITVDAFSGSDGDLAAMLVVAEEVEVFSASQGGGWNCAASNGEGLSRVLATERYPWRLSSPGASFVTAPRWLTGSRPDWVSNNDPTDRSAEATGCATLFLNYLRYQLRYPWEEIVAAAAPTLEGTYKKLTGRSDAFSAFSELISEHFPPGLPAGVRDDNPFPLGGCSAVSWAPQRLDLFARSAAGRLQHWWYPAGDGFGGPEDLGGAFTGIPFATAWGAERLDVFGRGEDGALNHWWYPAGDGFGGPEALGGALAGAPVAVAATAGQLDVFAQSVKRGLLHWAYSEGGGGFSNPTSLPSAASGAILGQPAAVSWAPDRLDVFAAWHDGGLAHWWSSDAGASFQGPEVLSGGVRGAPAAVSWASGRLDVFARGLDGSLQHWWYPGPDGMAGPENLGGSFVGDPAATSWAEGRLDIVVEGQDGAAWHWWYPAGDGFGGPENLGGSVVAGPKIASWSQGRLDIVGQGQDGAPCHWWYPAGDGGFAGPEALST
jgi:hypothetical protein